MSEWEYLAAHQQSQGLFRINSQLQILRNLEDPLYNDKAHKSQRVERMEKLLEEVKAGYMRDYYSKKLEYAKRELEELKSQKGKSQGDPLLLEKILWRLFNNEIKNLRLYLKKSENLLLAFSYTNKQLKISIPYIKQHQKNLILWESDLVRFIKMGFELVLNETRLQLIVNGDKQQILKTALATITKIVFDVFNVTEFRNESFIQFTEKPLSK